MLVHTNNMPDISNLKPKATSCYLASTLAGNHSNKTSINKKLLPILSRLIDKAIFEYSYARDYIEAEEAEGKMTYEEIIKRNQGQFIYTCQIIDHLENCITTLARIYKLREKHQNCAKNQNIIHMRNSIEHLEDRIREGVSDPPVLNISGDSLVIEVAARTSGTVYINTKDLAEEICKLYQEIIELI